MKNTNKSYVDRVVEKFKNTTVSSTLATTNDIEVAIENIKSKATESAERQNHSLQGEIYKAKDAVKMAESLLNDAKSASTLKFEAIKGMTQQYEIAKADLAFYEALQEELFPSGNPEVGTK